MKSDRAKHNLIPPSKFGVIEITRQRVRPETEIKTAEVCPTCSGSGEITASILFAEEIENNLNYLLGDKGMKGISLLVHPYLAAFFKKGLVSIKTLSFQNKIYKLLVRPPSTGRLIPLI